MASGEWKEPFAIRYSPFAYSMITSGSPNSTGWPSSTRICVTVPARGDGIWFIVFIASMISSVWPAVTLAADLDERLCAGLGRPIGGADHRRGHDARMFGDVGDGCRRRGSRSRRRRRGGRIARRHRGCDADVARDAHAQARALDLDLGEVGFVEQQRQLADRARCRRS